MGTINIRSALVLFVTVVCPPVMGQTITENFVKTESFINGNGGKVTTVQYCDGLGRPTLNATNVPFDIVGKTVVMVAHRLSTVRHMDRILVIDRGHLAE